MIYRKSVYCNAVRKDFTITNFQKRSNALESQLITWPPLTK